MTGDDQRRNGDIYTYFALSGNTSFLLDISREVIKRFDYWRELLRVESSDSTCLDALCDRIIRTTLLSKSMDDVD